jgi:hypothetical protein
LLTKYTDWEGREVVVARRGGVKRWEGLEVLRME